MYCKCCQQVVGLRFQHLELVGDDVGGQKGIVLWQNTVNALGRCVRALQSADQLLGCSARQPAQSGKRSRAAELLEGLAWWQTAHNTRL